MIIIIGLILLTSFFIALRSMKDFEIPKEIKKMIKLKSKKGSIVFFKNKIKHFHR